MLHGQDSVVELLKFYGKIHIVTIEYSAVAQW